MSGTGSARGQALQHARGRVLDPQVEWETYPIRAAGLRPDFARDDRVPFSPTHVLASETLTGADLKAANTFERPSLVAPRPLEAPRPGSRMTFKLPARSYSVVHMATA